MQEMKYRKLKKDSVLQEKVVPAVLYRKRLHMYILCKIYIIQEIVLQEM